MYNQIKSNIEKYTIEEASKAPDWDRLLVLHAWGGRKKEGLYSFCVHSMVYHLKRYMKQEICLIHISTYFQIFFLRRKMKYNLFLIWF